MKGRPDEYAAPLSQGQVALARLKLAAEMLQLLQSQLAGAAPPALHCTCALETVRRLEDVLVAERLIPLPARTSGRHIP